MTIFPVIFVCLFAAAYGHGNYPHKPPVDYKPPVYDYKPAPYAYKPYRPYNSKPAIPAKPKLVPIPIPIPLPLPVGPKPVNVAVQVSNIQEAGKGGSKGGSKGGLSGGLKKIASPFKKSKKQQGFVGNLLEVPNPGPVFIPKPVSKPILVPFAFPRTRNEEGGFGGPNSEAAAAASELGSFTDFMKPLLSSL